MRTDSPSPAEIGVTRCLVQQLVKESVLTYMATVDDLAARGDLIRIEVPLDRGELACRRLFGTPDFIVWLGEELPKIEMSGIGYSIPPIDQLDARFHQFISGAPFLTDRRFKSLNWTPQHYVWEIKTDDIRVFGWVPQKDDFICAFADDASRIKQFDLYGRYIAQTKYVRDQLPLDEPKFVPSRSYDDVISNAH